MCTAAKYVSNDFYFGRTLDNNVSYGENVIVTPRRKLFDWRDCGCSRAHHALIGMGCVIDGYPLYYDAVNERGLAAAGLEFVGNAVYHERCADKINVAQFEFIPWLLGACSTVVEVKKLLEKVNITPTDFSSDLPVAELHWIIADRDGAIVVESTESGLNVYDNPAGVLANNPPFPDQMFNLNNYMHLTPKPPTNTFSKRLDLKTYSRGMGALGLPGDLSSQSRFVRAAFTALNSPVCDCNDTSVSQFFHILGAVNQTLGSCVLDNGDYETTIYTSCCNATKGIYYYTCYDNHQICAVDMNKVGLDGTRIIVYPAIHGEHILMQN